MEAEGGRLFASMLAALFMAAGLSKVWGAEAWRIWSAAAGAAAAGRRTWAAALAALLPGAELLTVGLLVADPGRGLAAGALLLAGLGAGVLAVGPRMAGSPCSCYGPLSHATISPGLAVRNFSLSLLAVAASLPSLPGPLRPGELLVGAVLGAVLLMAGAGVEGRGRVMIGKRLHGLAGLTDAPAVIVVLSPGCPACERLAPMLAGFASQHRAAGLRVVIGAGPEPDRVRLAAVAGAERRPLERVVARWQVPGTPWGIAVGIDGRVVATGVTSSLADLAQLARSLDEPPERVSRRAILGVALTAALASLSAQSAAALARASRSPPRRAVRARIATVTIDQNDRNDVFGTCLDLADRLARSGVYVPGGRQSQRNAGGYTAVEGFEPGDPPSKVPASVINRRDQVEHIWKGYCPCDGTQYTDQTQCAVDCPQGLRCFGYQCVTTFEQWCARSTYGVELADPNITIYELHWISTGKHKCPAYANAFNLSTQNHELQHAKDAQNTVNDTNRAWANRSVRRCALTQAAALNAVAMAIAQDVLAAQTAAQEELHQKTVAFHNSPAGAHGTLDCRRCP